MLHLNAMHQGRRDIPLVHHQGNPVHLRLRIRSYDCYRHRLDKIQDIAQLREHLHPSAMHLTLDPPGILHPTRLLAMAAAWV